MKARKGGNQNDLEMETGSHVGFAFVHRVVYHGCCGNLDLLDLGMAQRARVSNGTA